MGCKPAATAAASMSSTDASVTLMAKNPLRCSRPKMVLPDIPGEFEAAPLPGARPRSPPRSGRQPFLGDCDRRVPNLVRKPYTARIPKLKSPTYPSGDPLGWLGCAGTSLGIFLDYPNT